MLRNLLIIALVGHLGLTQAIFAHNGDISNNRTSLSLAPFHACGVLMFILI